MNKFASELLSKKVILKRERAIVGTIRDIIIDPANGNFVGIIIQEGFGKNVLKALSEKDIIAFGLDFVLVSEYAVLGDIEEIVRVQNIINKKIALVKSKVYTESGTYLGKVYDYTIDLDNKRLSRLYVRHAFLLKSFDFLENKIISFEQIISIEKDKIVVSDASIKSTKKIAAKIFTKKEDEAVAI